MKGTRENVVTFGMRPWNGRFSPVLLVTYLLVFMVLAPTAATAAQSGALHRAVKAGDLDGLTKLREELGRTVREMTPGTVFRDCDQCPEMGVVPAGRFRMGDLSGDGNKAEKPIHDVAISEPLAVGVSEVTREAFERFVEATGYSAGNSCMTYESGEWKKRSGRHWRDPGFAQMDRHPVVCVSWEDAQAYVRWLSRETGQSYRLLSEAEWEYAVRAGTRTKYWWGNEADHDYANYGKDECCEGMAAGKDRWVNTSPVGSFEANAFGLFDTAGNVWEWVEDCWNENYEGAPADGSAWTSGDCGLRVVRGGSWVYIPRNLRSADRDWLVTGDRYVNLGFRVARTLTP